MDRGGINYAIVHIGNERRIAIILRPLVAGGQFKLVVAVEQAAHVSQKPDVSIEDAREAFLSGDMEKAEDLSSQILSDEASRIPALHMLGAIALRRELLPDALGWFEKAVKAGADDAIVYSNLGETYRRLGRTDEAIRCLEYSLQRNNADIAPHFNLAKLHRSRGEPRLAEHFFRNVLLLDPRMARAHWELAELYREEGHFSEAVEEYQAALDVLRTSYDQGEGRAAPLDSYWCTRLGSLVREMGATFRAIETLRHAVLLDSSNSEAHWELSRCLFEMCWEKDALTYCDASAQRHSATNKVRKEHLATKVESPKNWCERRGEQYVCLARAQALSVSEFQTIPLEARSGFRLGSPVTTEQYLANIPSAIVLPNQLAIVSDDGRLLLDGVVNAPQAFLTRGKGVIHTSGDLRVLLEIPELQFREDEACAVIGGGDDHYSWMFESLARMWALEQHPDYKDLSFVVPENLSESRREMLDAIGIDRNKIVNWPLDHRLLASKLVLPSLMVIGDWISPIGLQYLRRKLADRHGTNSRRIFLSRSTAAHSRLKNQAEILPLLLRHGFEIVDCIETSPMQLISILSDASVVIGCDDDSIANMVVAPLGAKVGVIVSDGTYRLRSYFVCGQLGHSLTYLVAKPDFSTNQSHARCDFSLEPKLLAEFLESLPAEA